MLLDELEANSEKIERKLEFLSDVIFTTTIATTATTITTSSYRRRRSMNEFKFGFLDNFETIKQDFRYIKEDITIFLIIFLENFFKKHTMAYKSFYLISKKQDWTTLVLKKYQKY